MTQIIPTRDSNYRPSWQAWQSSQGRVSKRNEMLVYPQ